MDNIIGLDFLEETQCVIVIPHKRLMLKDDVIPIYDSPQRDMTCYESNLPGPPSEFCQLPSIINVQNKQ
jgi:hypothetical protein